MESHRIDEIKYSMSLIGAAALGRVEYIQSLLDVNADPNYVSESLESSPLMEAVRGGHIQAVNLLLSAGADPLRVTKNETNPHYVAKWAHSTAPSQRTSEILKQINLHLKSLSLLMEACAAGQAHIVKKLINSGIKNVDLSAKPTEITPLFVAADRGHAEVVQTLLAAGANVNHVCGNKNATALTMACGKGYVQTVKTLIKHGANVNHVSDPKYSACTGLVWAALYGHIEIVRLLINANANINHSTNRGDTALLFSIQHGHTDIAIMLINNGADLHHASSRGETALSLAAAYKRTCVLKALAEK